METTKRFELYLKLKENLCEEQQDLLVQLDDEYGNCESEIIEKTFTEGKRNGIKDALKTLVDLI